MSHQIIPGFTAGGYQPYTTAGGRMPGMSLMAMLKGGPVFMPHPMDAKRAVQKKPAGSMLDALRR